MIGCEWVIEAHGCDAVRLSHQETLEALFSRLVEGMALHPVSPALWHQFPAPANSLGGLTGLLLLSESHLACHTFPEYSSLCLNVFCCRPRPEYDFKTVLEEMFGATRVSIRKLERAYTP
jgi:S-adenosylmethionine decarboxylase